MKLLKVLKTKVGYILFLTLLTACSDEQDNKGTTSGSKLGITASIETKAVSTTFKNGDKMSIFVKQESNLSSDNYVEPVVGSYENANWVLTPQVDLNGVAYVFAFVPSMNQVDPAAVPINIGSQTDYLYSGNGVKVNPDAPTATLTMKHALPMVAFNIAKSGYEGEGILSSIQIDGENLYCEGTLDISTGRISTTKKGVCEITTNKAISHEGWTTDLPQMFCLPFSSVDAAVHLTCVIDGNEYTVALPDVDVKSEMKYLFRLWMKEAELVVSDEVEVISLNKNADTMPVTYTLQIGYKGTEAVLPKLEGDNVSATVDWGDGSMDTYRYPLIHTYNTDAEYCVDIKLNGAKSVEFGKLDDIEYIDVSGF